MKKLINEIRASVSELLNERGWRKVTGTGYFIKDSLPESKVYLPSAKEPYVKCILYSTFGVIEKIEYLNQRKEDLLGSVGSALNELERYPLFSRYIWEGKVSVTYYQGCDQINSPDVPLITKSMFQKEENPVKKLAEVFAKGSLKIPQWFTPDVDVCYFFSFGKVPWTSERSAFYD